MTTFKLNDYVYCPTIDNRVYKLVDSGIEDYCFTVTEGVYVNDKGFEYGKKNLRIIFPANSASKQAILDLYGIEMEDAPREIYLLIDAGKQVACYVSNTEPEPTKGSQMALISSYVGNVFYDDSGVAWNYVTPIGAIEAI